MYTKGLRIISRLKQIYLVTNTGSSIVNFYSSVSSSDSLTSVLLLDNSSYFPYKCQLRDTRIKSKQTSVGFPRTRA